ncbi:MAG: type I polyketide synthase, partial [Candidatus Binataceae bacterium]
MAPNPHAQEAVLREAYRQSEASPGDVQYIEAHGTGTLLGDPIEAKALGSVLALGRPRDRSCLIGSVKTNIGHLEAAAGIAGLIKVALALKHHLIPPSLNFAEPNPLIPFDQLLLRVPTSLEQWPAEQTQALAGVSSFGFGGTNAHVVLQGYSRSESEILSPGCRNENPPGEIHNTNSVYLLPLSARSQDSLRSLARVYADFLTGSESLIALRNICYSASVRRSHHDYRAAVTGGSAAQLAEGLEAYLSGEGRAGLSSDRMLADRRRKLVFVFPGQGSQWFGMGRTLLHQEGVFREALERCEGAIRPYGDWSLVAELTATDAARSRLHEVDVMQPSLFAIQVALAALWRSWGIEPDAVVGHSMGEVAAAHVAGALSLEDAARVICSRSRIVKPAIGHGAMAAVELSIADAQCALAGYEYRISIAASNGRTSTVLSGDPEALATVVNRLQRQDIFCRMLQVDFAAHSSQMEPLKADLERALEGLRHEPASLPIYSTVTGRVSTGLSFDPLYWARNLREPVLFLTAIQQLLEDGHDTFLELSPHPSLLSSIQHESRGTGKESAVLPSLRREEEQKVLAGSLGALYTLGYAIDWSRVYSAGGRCVELPFYRWKRERCWLDQPEGNGRAVYGRPEAAEKASILGRHFESAQAETHFWEGGLNNDALSYLDDHRVEGVAVLPAALYVEMFSAAASEVFPSQSFVLRDVEFRHALLVPDGETRTIQVILSRDADGTASVQICSRSSDTGRPNGSWALHATGKICLQQERCIPPYIEGATRAKVQARCLEQISGEGYYQRLREGGMYYGPSFQSITQLWHCNGEILAELKAPDKLLRELNAGQFNPAILDACFQTLGA